MRGNSEMTVAEAIAEAFAAEGVDAAFVLMGDGNMHFVPHLLRRGAEIYSVRHENMGVAMADGYYRATGKIGVCSITNGPGLTQIGTCLMIAQRRGSSVVVMAGDSSRVPAYGGLQEMNQRAFIEASGGMFQPVRLPETVAKDVRSAFSLARNTPGPVVLNVPQDIQRETVPAGWHYEPSTSLTPAHSHPIPPAHDIEKIAELLVKSNRPVILAGRGAADPLTVSEIERLAEYMGALLATTLPAKGLFAGNPYDIGITGGYTSIIGAGLLANADLVISVGASLSHYSTKGDTSFPDAIIVHVNKDPHVLVAQQRGPDALLVGDAAPTIRALAETLEGRGHASTGYRTSEVAEQLARDPRVVELELQPVDVEADTVDPRTLLLEMDEVLPDDCIIVFCGAHSGSFVPRFLAGTRSRQFVQIAELGSIGQVMSAAIGMGLAQTGKLVVAFEGDGAAMMNIQELDTAARHHSHVLIVVLNDDASGTELHRLSADPDAYELAQIPCPNFTDLAQALGVAASAARKPGDAAAAVRKVLESREPYLIDVPISRRVIHWGGFGMGMGTQRFDDTTPAPKPTSTPAHHNVLPYS